MDPQYDLTTKEGRERCVRREFGALTVETLKVRSVEYLEVLQSFVSELIEAKKRKEAK
jgi:hypothetical protein